MLCQLYAEMFLKNHAFTKMRFTGFLYAYVNKMHYRYKRLHL